jgi:hypothetical protein
VLGVAAPMTATTSASSAIQQGGVAPVNLLD